MPTVYYTVTVSNGTAEVASGTNGQVVAISANTPASFKVFDRWTGDTNTVADIFSTNTTIRIAGTNVSVAATYRDAPYTLTVYSGSGSGQHARGDAVAISADAPPAMKRFDHWKVVPEGADLGAQFAAKSASTIVTMPGLDLELTATYTNIPTYTLTVNGGTGGGSYTNGQRVAIGASAPPAHFSFLWTGATATVADVHAWETTLTMPAADIAVTASYPAVLYPLTVKGGLGGGSYTNGQVVTVTATSAPSSLHAFDQWSGDTNAVADVNAATTTVTIAGATVLVPTYRPLPMGSNTYLVVDLKASQTNAAVSYLDAVPEGGWSDEDKTTKMVFRKISAGVFTMGSPSGEAGRDPQETQHAVTLTKVFYMGLFEVTQAQWENLTGNDPSAYTNGEDRATHPVEKVSYADVRGASNGAKWPSSAAVDSASFVGKFRTLTGDASFDLPTEAQWEYACRAGTTGAYAGPLDELGVYATNSGETTAPVGTKSPNAWGLYDMHGNVEELCLDWFAGDLGSASQVDPKGATGSRLGRRVMRGGAYSLAASYSRSAYRGNVLVTNAVPFIGLRMSRTAGVAYPLTVVNGTVNTGGLYLAGTPIPVGAERRGAALTFAKWTVSPANAKLGALFSATQEETVVTMPTNAVVLTATYAQSPGYTILTVANGTGSGSYTNGQAAAIGADAPPAWYVFDRWVGDTNGVADVSAATTTVSLAGGQVALSATYRVRGDLPADVNWLTVIDNGATNARLLQAGASAAIEAAAAPSGKVFGWWTVSPVGTALGEGFDAGSATTTVTMPAQAVAVASVYVTSPGATRGYADVRLTDQDGAVLDGAQWSPDARNWYPAGVCPLRPTTYSLTFKAPGLNWVAPAKKSARIIAGATNAVTGVFQWVPVVRCDLVKGAAADGVTLSPASGQVLPGKSVSLTAKPTTTSVFVQWEDGSLAAARTVAPATNATYLATFRLKSSYTRAPVLTPAAAAGTVGVAFSTAVAINERPATFAAQNLPPGVALNAQTGVLSGVPTRAGSYAVTVTATNPNRLAAATTLQIDIAPLAPLAQGTFTGYAGVGLNETNREVKGLLTMSVTSAGKITAKVTEQAAAYSFSGASWDEATAGGLYRVSLKTSAGEALALSVNAADGSLTGVATNGVFGLPGQALAGQRNAFLTKSDAGYAAATNALARYKGYYTVALPVVACAADGAAANQQGGAGYVTLTVKDGGAVAVSGKLAEGTAFSASGTLLLDDEGGYVPLMAPVYAKRGVFSGLLAIVPDAASAPTSNRVEACDGVRLIWRYPGKAATATEDRFGVAADAMGAYYDTLINVQSRYAGADLAAEDQAWNVPLAFKANGSVYLAAGANNPSNATLSVISKTGLFSGSFRLSLGGRVQTVKYVGVLTRDGTSDVGLGAYTVPQTIKVGTTSYAVKPTFEVIIE